MCGYDLFQTSNSRLLCLIFPSVFSFLSLILPQLFFSFFFHIWRATLLSVHVLFNYTCQSPHKYSSVFMGYLLQSI